MDSVLDVFLWLIFPYICLTIFVLGHIWRYRYDKFGWTSRSSQMYESSILRWASPMFHFGILAVFLGHVMGLGIPESWTHAVGISEGMYHFMAISVGAIAGVFTIVGLIGLLYRRRFTKAVLGATTPMDKVMYLMLALVILGGLVNTVSGVAGDYNYRGGVSVWFRSIFFFNPQPELMAVAPFSFQFHAFAAIALFALWPFTRLVHVFTAPLGYLFRPYVLYRSRDAHEGSREGRRGWDKVNTIPRRRP
ncbi:respiratory nitrate reductase subunit gamma [Arthrobacter roseus]|uniref:respiratory nitrate reductase subunit gamma n=1 Tax=Arthrobacter roseus TaxID=136274 RepID=UPI0019661BCE|nr:respiratory nitrate reductase subunit gamma [Arthrobacter roseus]MBM7849341.1 nitrate reductase gamma subunit [Arthrobacter roseus]